MANREKEHLDSEALDAGLSAAFRDGARPGESVLEAMERATGRSPRIRLKDLTGLPGGGDGDRTHSHYTFSDEIGRGGVGLVLKGRDVDLGREVAVKLLREEHKDRPEVVERFVEEAQIEGQLQHPGIIPVYELGVGGDGRPFFAMKLVEGETLAALLERRSDPGEDRRRFLSIFEQICQAVAYAHARGVIHRDLKPSNVMVGAFGEVQVVDWGLAKVLGREEPEDGGAVRTVRTEGDAAESVAGMVLGTPSYMPPEQARGRVGEIDARSDVFALGGILLTILTGEAPYGGEEQAQVLLDAGKGHLEGAWRRLEASGADEELVTLCRACLSVEMVDRPADAKVVAERIGGHLAAVEERARQAELSAAEARVKAAEERKARRLTVALAATVLLAVLFGGGGWLWVAGVRRAQAERSAKAVAKALEDARELLGKAEAAPVGERSRWDAALAAAQGAEDLARTGGAEEEDRERAADLLAQVEEGHAAAQAEAEQKAKDDALRPRLEQVRLVGRHSTKLQEAEGEFAAAFLEYGIDVDALSEVEVTARIRESRIADHLVAALDKWIWVRWRLGGRDDAGARRLLAIAQSADDDAARVRLRELAADQDREGLLALAREGPLERDAAWLLALQLGHLREHEPAVAVLRDAQLRHPEHFWLSFQLARELTVLEAPRWEEAVAYYRAAMALRPDSLELRHRLGFALEQTGALDEALALWWDTLPMAKEPLVVYRHIVHLHEQRGTLGDLLADIKERLEAHHEDAYGWIALGLVHMVRGEWEEAVGAHEEATRIAPEDPAFWIVLGDSMVHAFDPTEARTAYERAIELDPEFARGHAKLAYAKNMLGDHLGAAEACAKAVEIDPKNASYWAGQGQCYRHAGQPEKGLPLVRRAVSLEPDDLTYHYELVWIHLALGEMDKALEAAHLAQRLDPVDPTRRFRLGYRMQLDMKSGKNVRRAALGWDTTNEIAHYVAGFAREGMGDLEGALEEFREGHRLKPEDAYANHLLGYMHRRLGRFEEAVGPFRKALERNPANVWNRTHLGFALLGAGRIDEAEKTLRGYYETNPWLEGAEVARADWEQDLETLVRLARDLPGLRENPDALTTRRERAVFVNLLYELGLHAAATRLAASWFEEDPELARLVLRWPIPERFLFQAACTAIQAASGWDRGAEPPDDTERVRLRRLALEWMEEDWAGWRAKLDAGEPHAALHLRYAAAVRLGNPMFSMIRFESNLRRLPAEEANAWRAFWERVRDDRARAEETLAAVK